MKPGPKRKKRTNSAAVKKRLTKTAKKVASRRKKTAAKTALKKKKVRGTAGRRPGPIGQQEKKRLIQERFLKEFVSNGTITGTAKIVGITPPTHYNWMKDDEEYRDLFRFAEEAAADVLEEEARRRAVDGDEEPVGFYQGAPGAYVTKRSDGLLKFLLEGRRRRIFGSKTELSGPEGGPIKTEQTLDLSLLSTETLKRIKADLDKAEEEE